MLLVGVTTLVLTLCLTPLFMVLLRRRGVLDKPVARSSHRVATIRGGGLGAALAGALVMLVEADSREEFVIVATATAFAAIGLLDDLRGIDPLPRLAFQLVISLGVVLLLSAEFGSRGIVAVGLSILASLWLVSYVNAFNFMDGIDGISVAQAVVAGVALLVVGSIMDVRPLQLGGAAAAGCAAGFAFWNLPQAKVFLGDVGSYFFGGLLAACVLVGVLHDLPVEAVAASMALYLADTGWTIVRRARRREPLLLPHRTHVYQRLTDLGWSHVKVSATVGIIVMLCAALGMVSLLDSPLARIAADAALVTVLIGYVRSPEILRSRINRQTR
jgi:UDP-N-acetylmuramyl pentapeptide phosphotransferase/UDP-N-acetylglucosamine-1-phosphate transferase